MGWSEAETAGSVPERFAQQVKLRPGHPAIAGGSRPVSYEELGWLVDRYAGILAGALDPGPAGQGRAALLLTTSEAVIAAALAALKCGLMVVTLNPGDPAARLGQIRQESTPQVLITDELELGRVAGFPDAQTLVVGEASSAVGETSIADAPLPSAPRPDDLAFLISTSGSSGRPKLVMQTHRNVLHNVLRYTNGLEIQPEDRIALMASLSGGQGLATTWTALLNGATLCPFPVAQRGVTGLAGWLVQNEVTVFDTIPSVLRSFAQTLDGESISGIRLVRLASEGALRGDLEAVRRHFPHDCPVASVLASSEAGVIAQGILHSTEEIAGERLPVGRPAEGISVTLAGPDGDPAADGEIGEIVVQSEYLSPGYWGDDQLTAERFQVSDGVRRFLTGDLASRSAAGNLTIMGRSDQQVKVRGYRLQLEEVEAALSAQPGVAAAAVLLHTTARGDARLTAYVAGVDRQVPSPRELRLGLRDVLPPHAIPVSFVPVPAIPLTAHGKIDRHRLAQVEGADQTEAAEGATESETEAVLAALWAEAFERPEVGRHEAFLELGGDSLLAAQIAAGVHERFGVELDLRVFVADPTVATLAALVEERRSGPSDSALPPLRRTGRAGPLSFAQAIFLPEPGSEDDPSQHVLFPFRIRGPLDVEALRRSVEQVVRRHEILRTTFTRYDESAMAIVTPPGPVPLPVDDLRAVPDQSARVLEITEAELLQPYDLERGPLFRLRLLQLEDEHHQLLRLSHHLIHDADSWGIFFRELATFYEALIAGKPSPLADEAPLQYIDYAVWERAQVRAPTSRHEAEIIWWQRAFESRPALLQLPFQRSEPQPDAPAARPIWWGLPAEHATELDRIGRASGATFYMTRLALFTALLAIETAQDDFLIGTPMSTRTRVELHGIIGPFINYRPLRFRFRAAASFREWLADVRRVVIDAGAHASLPWQILQARLLERDVKLRRFSAMFIPTASIETISFGGLQLDPLPRPCPQSWAPAFRLGVNRPYEAGRCWAGFDPRIHDPAGVESFLSRLRALAAAVCAEPDRALPDLHAAISLQVS